MYLAGVERCTSTWGRPHRGLHGSSIAAVGTYFYPVERDSPATGGWGGVVFWGEHVTLADAGSFAVVRVVGVVLVGRKEQVTIPVELRRKWGEGMRVVVKAKGY